MPASPRTRTSRPWPRLAALMASVSVASSPARPTRASGHAHHPLPASVGPRLAVGLRLRLGWWPSDDRCGGCSGWRRTPSSCATTTSCSAGWPSGSPARSCGRSRAGASSTARTRATRWSARCTRRPGWTWSSTRPRTSTPTTSATPGGRAGARTPTRCGSSTTAGCRWTARSRTSSRSTARRWRRRGSRWPAVLDGSVPVVSLVTEVLAEHRPFQLQRVAAYALVVRDGAAGPEVLLTRNSAARPAPGLVDAPRRRHRPRRGGAAGAGPRGPGGDGSRLHPR